MLRELFYKWFGLELPPPCPTCEVLRAQLDEANRERKLLLDRIMNPPRIEESQSSKETELKPVRTSQYIPWRVKREMLEAEDRKKAELMRRAEKEIKSQSVEELEKELEINDAG